MIPVSIIMATYNGEKFISEQIDSILNNTFQNYDLHIYDDGSTDNTIEIIHKYTKRYNNIFLHQNSENKGVIRNFLCAVNELEYDYYMFCDQDDYWNKDKIEISLKVMKEKELLESEKPIVLFSDAQVVDESLNEIHPSFHRQSNLNTNKLDLNHIIMENKLIGCTIMLNKAVKKLLRDFPKEIRMHDWWIAIIGSCFGKIYYINHPLLKYRQHGNNTVGSMSELQFILNNISDLNKQKIALHDNCYQAGAFLKTYYDILSNEQRFLLKTFSELPKKRWLTRKITLIKYSFYKTGLLRNIGNLLLI